MIKTPETVSFLPPERLRPDLPQWAFGLEGPWLGRRLAADLERLATGRPALAALRRALAVWRFERQPLDAGCVQALIAAGRQAGSPRQRAMARALAPRLGPPPAARNWPALRDSGDRESILDMLGQGMADPAHDLYWRGRTLEYALTAGLPGLAETALSPLASEAALAPLAHRLRAEVAATFAGATVRLAAMEALDPTLFPRFTALARGDALIAAGDVTAGTQLLTRLWQQEPWHPGLTLRVHALRHPTPPLACRDLPGRVFVFVYTWNRADRLAQTLESLGHSRLGPARVVVLDNGANDHTPAVCHAARRHFAPGGYAIIRLPVNIGAPAARNWLAATAGLRPGDLVAYVDDDVLVPPDWLEKLAGALAADPGADVAGARILAGSTTVPQSADVRLLPPEGNHTVRPLRNCPAGPDFGLLAAPRPCASVSGCCHLLRAEALLDPAPFDIRFSPSQFDDLARDVDAFLRGRRCVLAGALAIAHHQPPTRGGSERTARTRGAQIKLDGRFDAPDMKVAAHRDSDTAWDELITKWRQLVRER